MKLEVIALGDHLGEECTEADASSSNSRKVQQFRLIPEHKREAVETG